MCTRYVFTDPAEAIRDLFRITAPLPNWPPNYNVAPTHIMPVVRPIDRGREIAMMEWGLMPFFSTDGVRTWNTFNARAEEVRTRNSYKEAFKTGAASCRLPAISSSAARRATRRRTCSRARMEVRSRSADCGIAG